tara:strand:+ start:4492 stop:5475 length:984 start_codon:yes stop_codon:yes gene_type:complete
MTTALITGGLGFIGSNLAKQLLKRRVVKKCILLDVFAGYVNPTKQGFQDYRKFRFSDLKNVEIIRGDAKDYRTVLNILTKSNPKYIFHTAAVPLAKIDNLNAKETKEGSIDTTVNILECLNEFQKKNKINLKRFVYISSSMVYGNFKKKTANENDICEPIELYGTMKLSGEIITKGLCKFFKIPFSIIRPSAVYGPTDMNNRVSQIFIEKALEGKNIKIQGVKESLDFTYVDDLVNGIILSATKNSGLNQIFNITRGKAEKLITFVKILSKYIDNINFHVTDRDSFRPKRGTLSVKKAKKLLGFKSKFSLEDGLKNYLNFLDKFKNN